MKNKMKHTIELITLMHDTLTDVIKFLDDNKYSNTKIREKVDMVLNHSKLANKAEREIEIVQVKNCLNDLDKKRKKEDTVHKQLFGV